MISELMALIRDVADSLRVIICAGSCQEESSFDVVGSEYLKDGIVVCSVRSVIKREGDYFFSRISSADRLSGCGLGC